MKFPPIWVTGCGDMGLPMLKRLLDAGFVARGFDIRPQADFPAEVNCVGNVLSIDDPESILIIVVRDADEINALLFEQQAIFSSAVVPGTVIICSTVSPRFIGDLRQRLPRHVRLIDAPMSGATYSAEEGTLTFMLGGDDADIGAFMPLFEAMGSRIYHVGPVGHGMSAKVLNNFITASSIVAVRRALHRGAAAGLDTTKLIDIFDASSGQTWFGSNLERIYWSDETYNTRNTVGIVEKDVRAALDMQGITIDEFDHALVAALKALPELPVK